MPNGIPVLPEIMPAVYGFYGFLFVMMILSMRVSSNVTITSMCVLLSQQCCIAGCNPNVVHITIYKHDNLLCAYMYVVIGFLNNLNNYTLSRRCRQANRLHQSYKQKEKSSIQSLN